MHTQSLDPHRPARPSASAPLNLRQSCGALLLAVALAPGFACSALIGGEDDGTDAALLLAALAASGAQGCPPYDWGLPDNVPAPSVPAENCMTEAKVELGRRLFYDRRLSRDESMSCASCHVQANGFTVPVAQPAGATGEIHPRNSQHLANSAYHARFNWANNRVRSLETQSLTPLFAESGPSTIVELGLQGDAYLEKLKNDATYQQQFPAVFGGGVEASVSEENVRFALAAFQRSILSFDSTFDRFQRGEASDLSSSALRGAVLFNSERAECFHCHGGFNFADSVFHNQSVFDEVFYHNNGIYSEADYAAMPLHKRGLVELSGDANDEGRFRAPSLRNVSFTFPYMHDGSFDCDPSTTALEVSDGDAACGGDAVGTMLGRVIDHYKDGAEKRSDGSSRTVHPTVDRTLIRPFSLTSQERTDMIEFLKSLGDQGLLVDPRFSNPAPDNPLFGP